MLDRAAEFRLFLEIVVSNMLYQRLPHAAREGFHELEPVEARNIGRVGAWKLGP